MYNVTTTKHVTDVNSRMYTRNDVVPAIRFEASLLT